MIFKFVESIR